MIRYTELIWFCIYGSGGMEVDNTLGGFQTPHVPIVSSRSVNWVIIDIENDLSPISCQAIIQTNAYILWLNLHRTIFKCLIFSHNKCIWSCRQCCDRYVIIIRMGGSQPIVHKRGNPGNRDGLRNKQGMVVIWFHLAKWFLYVSF